MGVWRYNHRRRTEQNGRGNFFRTRWGGTALVVNMNSAGNEAALDKTWQEIYDAFSQGGQVQVAYAYSNGDYGTYNVLLVSFESPSLYSVVVSDGNYPQKFTVTSPSDYPSVLYA